MVRQNILRHIKPEPGHLGQDSAFLADLIAQDHVETADPVRGHHDQGIAVLINFTYLALFHGLKFLNAHLQSPHWLFMVMLLISYYSG